VRRRRGKRKKKEKKKEKKKKTNKARIRLPDERVNTSNQQFFLVFFSSILE
jgi:hypothetical protein